MAGNTEHHFDNGLATREAKPKLNRPSLYRVILLNDDYTPMEFVVHILEAIFLIEREKATRIMMEVHVRGKGVCGVFTHEIAETKVAEVINCARENEHPLLCIMEKI